LISILIFHFSNFSIFFQVYKFLYQPNSIQNSFLISFKPYLFINFYIKTKKSKFLNEININFYDYKSKYKPIRRLGHINSMNFKINLSTRLAQSNLNIKLEPNINTKTHSNAKRLRISFIFFIYKHIFY